MKKVKLILSLVFAVLMNVSYAQLQKGNFLAGGNLSFSTELDADDSAFGIGLNSSLLGFVTDKLAIGGNS